MTSSVDDGYIAFVGTTIGGFFLVGSLGTEDSQIDLGCRMRSRWQRMSEKHKKFFRTMGDDQKTFLQTEWAEM